LAAVQRLQDARFRAAKRIECGRRAPIPRLRNMWKQVVFEREELQALPASAEPFPE